MKPFKFFFQIILTISICLLVSCGGTKEYKLIKTQKILQAKQFKGNVSLQKISAPPIYQKKLGANNYKIHIKEAIEKQFSKSLEESFTEGLAEDEGQYNIFVTVLDISAFPVFYLIIDIRIFFKIEIFDKNMEKLKTVMVYGFGSDPDGNRALEKTVANAYYQLLPYLEELFYR